MDIGIKKGMGGEAKRKKILFIVHDFPPDAGGGSVMRTVKFVKFVQYFGWKPLVLTVNQQGFGVMADDTLMKEIQGVPIYRSVDFFYGFVKKVSKCWFVKGGILKGKSVSSNSENSRIGNMKELLKSLAYIPDKYWSWFFSGFVAGSKIMRKQEIDLIYTTSPPHTSHIIGLFLKKVFNKPWVIDFRDRWGNNPIFRSRFEWRQKIGFFLEKVVVRNGDCIITTTNGISKYYQDKYSNKEIKTLWNGYDEEDFKGIGLKHFDKFTICYVGSLEGPKRSFNYILTALEKLEKRVLRSLQLLLIGYVGSDVIASINRSKAKKSIKVLSILSHRESIRYMLSANVLLLILFPEEDGYIAVPGKVFEYIRARKSIFAICPSGGEVWNLVKEGDSNVCVDSKDIEGIQMAMLKLYERWKQGRLLPPHYDERLVKRYDRKEIVVNLVDILNNLV